MSDNYRTTLKIDTGDACVDLSGTHPAVGPSPLTFQQGAVSIAPSGETVFEVGFLTKGPFVSVKAFGAVADWNGSTGTDNTAAIEAAIDFATTNKRPVLLDGGSYKIASTINLSGATWLVGASRNNSRLYFTGTSSAIKASNWTGKIAGLSVFITNAAANGIEVGTASRNASIEDVYLDATAVGGTTTGAGFYLKAGIGFSGGLTISTCYALAFKYGLKIVSGVAGGGVDGGDGWTTVMMYNLWLLGNSSNIVANSAGIYIDAESNPIGTAMYGGTIESFAKGIQHVGGLGGVFETDMEGNTTDIAVADTFIGRIVNMATGATTIYGPLRAQTGVVFPTSDPNIVGAWWDNAGTLTKSAG